MKRIKWRFTCMLTGSLYLCTMLSMAQSLDPPVHQPTFRTDIQAPNVAMLNRFGDYPVDLANGLVDISIPLHTVQDRQLTLPITMRFHASGLRSSDYEGPLGLGWALDAGGHISRTVRGYPDEMEPFVQGLGPNTQPHFGILFGTTLRGYGDRKNSSFYNNRLNTWDPSLPNTEGEYRDTEYDIFTYRLPNGKSGKFILEDVNGTKIPFVMPYEPIKIEMYRPSSSSSFNAFEITDTDGTKYRFGSYDSMSSGTIDYNLSLDNNNGYDFSGYGTTWYLSSIVSADGVDLIRLQYDQATVSRKIRDIDAVVISDNIRFPCISGMPYFSWMDPSPSLYDILGDKMMMDNVEHFSSVGNNTTQTYKPLKSITFTGGIVEFNYYTTTSPTRSLEAITVKETLSSPAKTLKKISFGTLQRKSGSREYPGLLKTMSITDGNQTSEIYRFDYYNDSDMPKYNDLIDNQDAWGFYRSGTPRGVVEQTVGFSRPMTGGGSSHGYSTIIGAGSARIPTEYDMKIGMIQSIVYPTGGKTEFDYEPNSFTPAGGIPISGPGLRIRSLVNDPAPSLPNSQKEERTFVYASPRIPYYMIPIELLSSPPYWQNHYTEKEMLVYLRYDQYYGEYQDMAYYTIRTYYNQLLPEYFDFSSRLISYDQVTEYLGTASVNSGKIVNRYIATEMETEPWTNEPPYHYWPSLPRLRINPQNFWLATPHISIKEYYDSSNNLVHKTDYSYAYLTKSKVVYDLPVERFRDHHVIDFIDDSDSTRDRHLMELVYNNKGCSGQDYEDLGYLTTFAYHNQAYNTGSVKLAQVTETSYWGGLPTVSSTETYAYNDHYLLSSKSKSNSDGTVRNTTYRYPFEITGGIYPQMTGLNMLSMPIEITERSDNKVTGGTLTTYKNFGNSKYYPEYLYALKKQEGLPFTAYNGSVGNHYHTPAESQVTQRDSKGNIQEVLEKGVYTTYLWGYNVRYPVAEIKNVRYSQIPYSITSNQASTVPDTTALNNLRTSLPNAMVTTYTYKPLVGIETITDPSGRKTTYEYDTHGRLIYIKDENSHILEKYEYNYKN